MAHRHPDPAVDRHARPSALGAPLDLEPGTRWMGRWRELGWPGRGRRGIRRGWGGGGGFWGGGGGGSLGWGGLKLGGVPPRGGGGMGEGRGRERGWVSGGAV